MTTPPRPVVVITGATGNLGTAVAHAFQLAGAHTVLVDRATDRLRRQFPDLAESADHLLLDNADLADEAAATRVMAAAVERFGCLDVLVNTIGAWRGGRPTHETPLTDWDFLFDANVRTTLLASRAAVPHFLARHRGCIINIAARSALAATAGSAAYSAAKSAVLRLTEAMSAELKQEGINVNALLPAIIDTPQNRTAMPGGDPAKWVQPDALAEIVLFLASASARPIHGAAIPVYGLG